MLDAAQAALLESTSASTLASIELESSSSGWPKPPPPTSPQACPSCCPSSWSRERVQRACQRLCQSTSVPPQALPAAQLKVPATRGCCASPSRFLAGHTCPSSLTEPAPLRLTPEWQEATVSKAAFQEEADATAQAAARAGLLDTSSSQCLAPSLQQALLLSSGTCQLICMCNLRSLAQDCVKGPETLPLANSPVMLLLSQSCPA